MSKTATIALSAALVLFATGCADMKNWGPGIMQATPGDPVGSANTGTGSVTTNSMIAPEAKSAGLGISP